MPWLLGNNPSPLLPPSLIALSKFLQWLFQGVTIFSSPLTDLYHSFELETSPNPPGSMGKEDPSSALYTAPPPSSFLTSLLRHELKPWSPHPYSVPHSAWNFSCFSPVWWTVIFLEDSRQTSECPDHPRQVNCQLSDQAGHEDAVYIWPGQAWGRSIRHSTACGFWFPDTPASEHSRWAALPVHSRQPQISSPHAAAILEAWTGREKHACSCALIF